MNLHRSINITNMAYDQGVGGDNITIYFLDSPVENATGASLSDRWAQIAYIELYEGNNLIPLNTHTFSASSYWDLYYYPNRVLTGMDNNRWCSATGNDPSPLKTCWYKINNARSTLTRMNLHFGIEGGSRAFRHLEVVYGTKVVTVDNRNKAPPIYPINPIGAAICTVWL